MTGSSVVASTTGCCGFSERFAVTSTDSSSAGIQVPVSDSDTLSGIPVGCVDKSSLEILEFLRFPCRRIEQPPVPGWPLTAP